MTDVTAAPAFITAPTDEQVAVDVYDAKIDKPPSISDEATVNEQLAGIEPGIGNMWGFDLGVELSPSQFGLSKPIDMNFNNIKDSLMNNPTMKSAYSGLSTAHQSFIFGTNAVKGLQNGIQQSINGVTNTISNITNGALTGLYNFTNTFFGMLCSFNIKDINMTINLTINVLNLAMLYKLRNLYNCVLASPILNPSMLGTVIKNMIPKIVISGDIEFLKAICNTSHDKEVTRYNPTLINDFLEYYQLPAGLSVLDYDALYEDVVNTYDILSPGWTTYTRVSGDTTYDATPILNASNDFKMVLQANASNKFVDLINDSTELINLDTATNTPIDKYYLALCNMFEKVDTQKELKKSYPTVSVN